MQARPVGRYTTSQSPRRPGQGDERLASRCEEPGPRLLGLGFRRKDRVRKLEQPHTPLNAKKMKVKVPSGLQHTRLISRTRQPCWIDLHTPAGLGRYLYLAALNRIRIAQKQVLLPRVIVWPFDGQL